MPLLAPADPPLTSSIALEAAEWIGREGDAVRILTNIACLVGNQFRCDACSIYLVNPLTNLLTLAGTVGLRQECVGQIRMNYDEGLTGLCAQSRSPVIVCDAAASHPNFCYFPDAGEDLYESFLGVPLENGSELVGVLVLQTFEAADFRPPDIAKLSTVARELGPHLAQLVEPLFEQLGSVLADGR
jgi:phosphotransferase system enzyme I (PtsP)